jgi:drug/metabolite transporter (DMT)-like permease
MGYLFAIFAAALESGKDTFSKIALNDDIDEYITSWALRFFALAVLWPILFFIEIPELNQKFWLALFASGTLNVVATILYMKAIQYEDLSKTIPMISFTPLFLLATSPLIVGEFPSGWGLVGVILIVIGAYTLNIHKHDHGDYLAPIKSIFEDKGTKLMLLVAFI